MLEVSDLVSGYGKSEVLREISLKVVKGQIVTIIGPNGAGKTTLFRTIFGLLPARKGTVVFENEDLSKLSPLARIQRGIALVPQGRAVFPDLSVLENMEMGAYTVKDKKQVQETMEECYHLFPVLRERVKQRAGTLSGGEQRAIPGHFSPSRQRDLQDDRRHQQDEEHDDLPGGAECEHRPQTWPLWLCHGGGADQDERLDPGADER